MSISKRLRDRSDHYLPDWARETMDDAAARIDEVAAFLDRLADFLADEHARPCAWRHVGDAADCREMARKLRGET